MTDMNAQMVVNADNRQFIRSFAGSETSINRFGKQIPGVMHRSGRKICRFGDKIGGLASRISGLRTDVRFKKELFENGKAIERRIEA